MNKDPENYIYKYFEDIKRQVDLRREDLKSKIDTHSDEIIESINNAELECKRLSKEINKMTEDFDNSKKELNDLINQFETSEINDKKFENIKNSVSVLKDKFNEILIEYKSSLINHKECDFWIQFEDVNIGETFGYFDEVCFF